jgi:hypothetical protein
MGERWLPYAAAALATGASALVMGALTLPSSPNGSELVDTLKAAPDRWLLASVAFLYAAFALTVGIPTFLHLLKTRGRSSGLVGASIFAFGTIGTAGYAAMLLLFRALVVHAVIEKDEIESLSRDPGLLVYMGAFVLAFGAGLVVIGVALLRAGTVARWIPVLMIGYALTLPLAHLIPDGWQGAHTLILGVALIGVAVNANESWSGVSRRGRR